MTLNLRSILISNKYYKHVFDIETKTRFSFDMAPWISSVLNHGPQGLKSPSGCAHITLGLASGILADTVHTGD